ncbi:B-cell differentiation antigen CD72 [Acomys russatus]|uniref:B-cell differentiation antigen CD72 n=1 Tax=Acomys russatus TaxID=60746 RepID=UPI0021E2E03F|nr:B-cell differentiation antigen CD72 [Acomys russatus]
MADAITYADLRFVKVPVKKSLSNHLGQDCESYEDGELTYENVYVSPGPGGPSGLASAPPVDQAGVRPDQPTSSWSSLKPAAVGWIPACPTVCLQYFLLGLLLACLVLVVAVLCLGVRYLQVSQQFQEVTRILEATNSSLQQQLREKTRQLGQREVDLQVSQRELTLRQEALQERQRTQEATEQELQACRSDGQKTRENLGREEQQRRDLRQQMTSLQGTLKRFFSCPSGSCCSLGLIQQEKRCFYISRTPRSWEESQKYCASLSSKLAVLNTDFYKYPYQVVLPSGLEELLNGSKSYWIHLADSDQQRGKLWSANCYNIEKYNRKWWREVSMCKEPHPCICELEAFRFPDEHPLI